MSSRTEASTGSAPLHNVCTASDHCVAPGTSPPGRRAERERDRADERANLLGLRQQLHAKRGQRSEHTIELRNRVGAVSELEGENG